jgi:hypothetical protein
MPMDQIRLPHDQRTTVIAMAMVIAVAALLIFLMMTLVQNVGAY